MRKLVLLLLLSPFVAGIERTTISGVADTQDAQDLSVQSEKLKEAASLATTVTELHRQGKYDEAIPIAKRVLTLREASLPAGDDSVVAAITNLAELYNNVGNYRSASELYERLLRVREKSLGKGDVKVLPILTKLAYLSYTIGDYRKSEMSFRRILSINEETFGDSSAEVSQAQYQLAEFYRNQRNFKQAHPLYDRALTIRLKLYSHQDERVKNLVVRYQCLLHEHDKAEMLKSLTDRLNKSYKGQASSSGVLNGIAISLPKPEYPEKARNARVAGRVVVKVSIDELGRVTSAEDMCGGPPYITEASLEAARKARFSPTKLSGQPVKVTGVIVYNFTR
ncbi:MAG TPA: TonB family protein [Pyrinomonadaceae bacterium]|nr:TonB family protein [Pyrinomonadaceae bacterium]